MCSSRASGMPGPSSSTLISITVPVSCARRPIRPFGGEKLWALPIRLRRTCTSRSSTACTNRPSAGASSSIRASPSRRVASWISASRLRIFATSTFSVAVRESSASTREASEMSLISRSSRVTSSPMMASRRFCCTGSSIRRSVSIALRIEDSGFFSSCATSAANCSIASMRAHSAPADSDRATARAPTSSCRLSSGSGTLPSRPLPSRICAAARARRRIGRAMVRDRYQDSTSVSTSAMLNSARIETRMLSRLSSTSRASRVSRMMPTLWRLCSTGTDTVTSSRLSLVRRI